MARCEESDDDEPFIWDTEKVLKKLAKIIELHEKVNRMPQLENKFKNEKRLKPENNFSENAWVFFNSNAQTKQNFSNKNNTQKSKPQLRKQKQERKILPCIFCNDESHRSTACQKYSTGEARQKRLAILKNAFGALKTHETILTLTPSHRIAQLLIRGSNKLPMGIVDITIEDIVVECQKSSEYFSRSHEIKTYSSKRCPKQGSCTGNTCANTKLDSKIPELKAVNDLPGNTFCIDSCSFLMCGCGFPTTSCIFYRLHAVERSKKIYEFFNCPAWQYAIELAIKRTNDKGKTQIDKIRLYNGILTEISGLKLAINAITKAPTPILATRFLTDGDKVRQSHSADAN
ncbi:unnamed protein product [Meloidogyne enterolobii]|uniref:Uncharacterized protein n=1 Tax=Meloidogyne enterolobii TaxID=390850 RepID=A0ACB0ZMY5_MELEN